MLTGYIRINKTKAIRIKKKNQAICTMLRWFLDLTFQLDTTRVQLPEVFLGNLCTRSVLWRLLLYLQLYLELMREGCWFFGGDLWAHVYEILDNIFEKGLKVWAFTKSQ